MFEKESKESQFSRAPPRSALVGRGRGMTPNASSNAVRIQPIRGRGRGGGRGHGRPGQVGERGGRRTGGRATGCSTDETSMPPEYSTPP